MLKTGRIAPGFVIEGIEPLNLGDMAVTKGFDLKIYSMQAFGASSFKIEKIRANVEKLKVSKGLGFWKTRIIEIYGLQDRDDSIDAENLSTLAIQSQLEPWTTSFARQRRRACKFR